MAPSKNQSHSSSNRHGEFVGRQASILASAYCVDSSARLTGFHYSTTGAGGKFYPSSRGADHNCCEGAPIAGTDR